MRPAYMSIGVALAVALTACIPNMRYRYFPDEPRQTGRPKAVRLPAREDGPGYRMSFIEFDDKGAPWAPRQTEEAARLLRDSVQGDRSAIAVLYVHGWHNNANRAPAGEEKDVEKFQKALRRLALEVNPTGSLRMPQVVGIYAAWRGGSLKPDALKWATYWPRRAVARQVGMEGLLKSIEQVLLTVENDREKYKLFLIGHSFGARVLEHAVDRIDLRKPERSGSMAKWMQRSKDAGRTLRETPPPADLVVYVNAASRSTVTRTVLERLGETEFAIRRRSYSKEKCGSEESLSEAECRTLPLYLAVTSTADLATGLLLPTANLIWPTRPFAPHLRSAANTGALQSHQAVETPCPAARPFRCEPAKDRDFCFEALREGERYCYEVRRKPGSRNETAFWIMNVNSDVIKDHGDIWNENLLDMLSSLAAQSPIFTPKQPARIERDARMKLRQ